MATDPQSIPGGWQQIRYGIAMWLLKKSLDAMPKCATVQTFNAYVMLAGMIDTDARLTAGARNRLEADLRAQSRRMEG